MSRETSTPALRKNTTPRFAVMTSAVVALVVSLVGIQPAAPAFADSQTALDPGALPTVVTDPDTVPVELGMKFSSSVNGTIDEIRFYKAPQNTGVHTGSLWTSSGELLARATFSNETATGWQTAKLPTPVPITAGSTYVASYFAPLGRYSTDIHGFDTRVTRGQITVPAGAGVYSYGGGFPEHNYLNSNYYVDVLFTAGATPTTTPTTPPVETPVPPTTDPGVPSTPSNDQPLPLPRIPWEGGSDYWKQFPKADAAGWDDPNFFPILAWFNGVSNDEEVQYDKSLGINTYSGMWEGTPYSLFEDNDVFWVGQRLNDTFTAASANWVGNFLDDEVDGRFTPAQGRAHLQRLVDSHAGDGRFNYANYTQMVMGKDLPARDAEAYVNDFTDVVSIDMYWYTIPYCDLRPYRDVYLTPVNQANCRTASSYGKTINSLRIRDAADGELQPLWQWIENLNGGPGEGPFVANITPGQLKGAVMNSLINEARGIAYFNQSHTGPCQGGSIFRQSQGSQNFCGAAQVEAAKTVNGQIAELAPVLNSQSYEYSFGSGLDTMLKSYSGDAYVFAMVDGESQPGSRTFTLPAGVAGTSVEVLFENRSIAVDGARQFTDTFGSEYSYHIYRIAQ
jgi:hypothetical protein